MDTNLRNNIGKKIKTEKSLRGSYPPNGKNIPCSEFVKTAAREYPVKSKSLRASSAPTVHAADKIRWIDSSKSGIRLNILYF